MFKIPKPTNKLRWAVIIYAIFVLVWSGRESTSVMPITLISFGIVMLAMSVWVSNRFGGHILSVRSGAIASMLIGGIIGCGTSVTTASMMMFVNFRHAHLNPDFPPELVGAMLQRLPSWTLAGGLMGLALALLWIAVQPEDNEIPHTQQSVRQFRK